MLDLAQIAFHVGAQRAQVGSRGLGVGAHGLRFDQHGIDFFQAVARVGQQGVQLHDGRLRIRHHALVAKDARIGIGHQAIRAARQLVRRDQQGVGPLDQQARLFVVARQQAHGAARTAELAGHGLHVAQGAVECGIAARQVAQVVQQVLGGGQQARDFRRHVAHQQVARGVVGQRRVRQDAAVGAQLGAADDAPFQGEDGAGAQPVRVFARHVDDDARAAVRRQLDALHAADGKAGKGQVGAHADAVRIVGRQHQGLRGFEGAARIHQVDDGADHQHEHEDEQDGRLQFGVAHGRRGGQHGVGRRDVGLVGIWRLAHGFWLWYGWFEVRCGGGGHQ